MFGLSPSIIIAFLISIAVATGAGFKLGIDSIKADLLDQQEEHRVAIEKKQKEADSLASVYESLQQSADAQVIQLRRQLHDSHGQLSSCNGNVALLNARFIRLRNESLQAGDRHPGQSADAATGADSVTADDIIENDIENGRRWKQCRDQLNALIEVVR